MNFKMFVFLVVICLTAMVQALGVSECLLFLYLLFLYLLFLYLLILYLLSVNVHMLKTATVLVFKLFIHSPMINMG